MAKTLGRILFVRPPRRSVPRRAAVALGVVLLGLVAFRVGVGAYLNSARGRAVVAENLQSMLGMPVEVADVELGARTSAVKFRVLDPTRPDRPEVLAVDSAAADVSFAEVVARRATASQLDLTGVNLTLRVGDDGLIQTTIPPLPDGAFAPGPRLVVERGRITIRRVGRPDFVVRNLSFRAEPDGGAINLSGTIDDPNWGTWKVAAAVDRKARTGWIEFTTASAPDAEKLRAIPFVPPQLWGDVTRAFTVRAEVGADGKPRYTITR